MIKRKITPRVSKLPYSTRFQHHGPQHWTTQSYHEADGRIKKNTKKIKVAVHQWRDAIKRINAIRSASRRRKAQRNFTSSTTAIIKPHGPQGSNRSDFHFKYPSQYTKNSGPRGPRWGPGRCPTNYISPCLIIYKFKSETYMNPPIYENKLKY